MKGCARHLDLGRCRDIRQHRDALTSTPSLHQGRSPLSCSPLSHCWLYRSRRRREDERAPPSNYHDSPTLCVRAKEVRVCLISGVHSTNSLRHACYDGRQPTEASPNQHEPGTSTSKSSPTAPSRTSPSCTSRSPASARCPPAPAPSTPGTVRSPRHLRCGSAERASERADLLFERLHERVDVHPRSLTRRTGNACRPVASSPAR